MTSPTQPILIIGAGVAGLTLAQACRKENIPFKIFERDASSHFRPAGWALTLNWSLPTLKSLLPEDIFERLPEAYVNRDAQAAGAKGDFAFYDLSNGDVKWKVPPSERIRVSRERLRLLLLSDIDVAWSKALEKVEQDATAGVTVSFTDGTSAKGSMMIACDGANSMVRRNIHPTTAQNWQLPVRIVGAKAKFPASQMDAIRRLDPYFFQGSHPKTDVYTYFSFIDTPSDRSELQASRDGETESMYVCQIMISWPYRSGFFGRHEPIDVPATAVEQLKWMQTMADDWVEPFRSIVYSMPADAEIKSVMLSDWVPPPQSLVALDGRAVLVGDAAHAMVMYRGEGANHSIVDVGMLMETVLRPLFHTGHGEGSREQIKETTERYQSEVIERTQTAVLASRQACLDAHDFHSLSDESPLVKKRIMRADLRGEAE